jgi:HD-like signal output (HDOD) protein
MAAIAQQMPVESRPEPQILFLAGLIHNIGFLLLGHEFREEYSYLNKLIDANPKQAIITIEKFTFGCDHAQLGAWLMQSWSMPKPIVNIVYHHHNPYYRGDNYHLNLLVFLNDYLLGTIGVGDAENQQCPDMVYEKLNVKKTDCEHLLNGLSQDIENIKLSVDSLF